MRAIEDFQQKVPATADVRRFVNGGLIVGLYGALENYVERLVEDAVETYLECCFNYNLLPKSVLASYSSVSAEVLTAIANDRYNGQLTQLELAEGLHRTLQGRLPIPMQTRVFSRHTANFRWEQIRFIFARAGIDVDGVKTSPTLTNAMKAHFPTEGASTFVIDDLAERRNALAHGSASDLLSLELLEAYVAVVEAFCAALYDAVASATLRYVTSFGPPPARRSLGRPYALYQKQIACFYCLPCEIQPGDLFAAAGGRSTIAVVVEEVVCEGVTVPTGLVGASVGIRLSRPVTKASEIIPLPESARRVLA
ncbi:HEPN domain-containing protein [Nocardioides sp. P86]|uniref:HEPN domain-containing protein n=1 Tax=Nocardioides sp. P86 TaxID=2939569 RepID=UPI00203CE9F0|nr:HEPN domain-containing protein [Nocardioides sp. P86]MCM3515076.1 HEPN domain-containing protein [Nocardioides sp. P86]